MVVQWGPLVLDSCASVFVQYIGLVILILIGIIYITLVERKVLGCSQLRLGPDRVSLIGLVQPVLDGVKLVLKVLVMCFVCEAILM